METVLIGKKDRVVISPERPVVIIGERINPTGKPRLAQALHEKDTAYVCEKALEQVAEGAQALDVNVGAAGINEVEVLPLMVQAVAEAVDVPLCIDTAHKDALRAALRVCPGKPLINSVNGEEERLEAVLPLVKEHGAAVIGLTMDDRGIPNDPRQRLEIATKILNRAEALGIPREDVIIDCLALTVGADHNAARVTLETIKLVRAELGVNITLGASNVSFGLPDRETINDIFVAMAILAGMNCPIVNPGKARKAILIADLLLGRDEFGMRYLSFYRQQQKKAAAG